MLHIFITFQYSTISAFLADIVYFFLVSFVPFFELFYFPFYLPYFNPSLNIIHDQQGYIEEIATELNNSWF